MARYKPYDLKQDKFIPVSYADQVLAGTFEHALNDLVENHLDMSVFDLAHHVHRPLGQGRAIYSKRMGTVEPVFGNGQNKSMRRFTLRGKRKVGTQWKLFMLVQNIETIATYATQ